MVKENVALTEVEFVAKRSKTLRVTSSAGLACLSYFSPPTDFKLREKWKHLPIQGQIEQTHPSISRGCMVAPFRNVVYGKNNFIIPCRSCDFKYLCKRPKAGRSAWNEDRNDVVGRAMCTYKFISITT